MRSPHASVSPPEPIGGGGRGRGGAADDGGDRGGDGGGDDDASAAALLTCFLALPPLRLLTLFGDGYSWVDNTDHVVIA